MGKLANMFNLGYEDLIPLVGKAPTVEDWPNYRATLSEVLTWEKEGRNVGLLARNFPGIDCDITDSKLALKVREFARLTFGTKCPIRIGKPPKWLLVTRLPEGATPLKKRKLTISKDGVSFSIELLGDGQQYVVGGIHPDTKKRYTWEGEPVQVGVNPDGSPKMFTASWPRPLHEWPLTNLPEITPEKVDEFFAQCVEYFSSLGWVTESEAAKAGGAAINPEQLYAPSLGLIRSAVRTLPNALDTSRDKYVGLAHMVKGACRPEWEEDGKDIFLEWARRWPGEVNEAEDQRVWDTMKRDSLRSGWGLLRELAEREGWTETDIAAEIEAKEEFDVLEEAPEPEMEVGLTLEELQNERTLLDHILPWVDDIFTSGDNDWFMWDSKRWVPDDTRSHRSQGRLAQYIYRVADEVMQRYPKPMKTRETQLRRLGSAKLTSTMFLMASRDGRLYVPRESVNDPEQTRYLLCTPGGIVDLRTSKIQAFDPALRITHITGVAPAFGAPHPRWDEFLLSSCGGDEMRVRYIWYVLGSALTTDVDARLIWFIVGQSGAGKSTLLKHVHRLIGTYAGVMPEGLLISGGEKAHSSALADLRDRRFIHGSEIDRGHRWNVALLKAVTGNEEIAARRLYHAYETFRIVGKILIAGNETPTLTSVDSAIKARLRIIPFTLPHEPDLDLDRKLEAEYPAILAWIIEGARHWIEEGYPYCSAVETITDQYIIDEDFLTEFRDTNFLVTGNPEHFVRYADLMSLWNQFMPTTQQQEYGLRSTTSLSKALQGSDDRIRRDNRRVEGQMCRGLAGLMLREEANQKLTVEDLL